MAKSRRRSHRSRSRGRRMRGGSYSSASTYGTYVNGDTNAQYNRVFDQSGAYGQLPGNVIIGAQGQNVVPASQMPNGSQLALVQKAGRRRRKGGFLGEVISQAVVPFAILGAQQTYGKRRGGSRRTRRRS